MIPKLEEAFAPLEAGVGAVHIVGPGEIAAALAHPGTVGTLRVSILGGLVKTPPAGTTS